MDSECDSEVSIYQHANIYSNINNMNNNNSNNEPNNSNSENQGGDNLTFRHLEFDRGISYSFFSRSNKISTIQISYIRYLIKEFFSSPFNFILIVLMLSLIPCFFSIHKFNSFNAWYSLSIYFFLIIIQVVISAIKYIQLNRNDQKVNNRITYIYDCENKSFLKAKWKNVLPGHIIKVNKDETVPADMLILEVSNSGHKCYVDTSGITGYFSQLSVKTACNDTQVASIKKINIKDFIHNIRGVLKFEEPNTNLNSFKCRMKMKTFPRASDVTIDNLILRGSVIKNVDHVYGLVIYVGMECKVMQFQKDGCYKENKSMPNNSFLILQKIVILVYFIYLILLQLIELHKAFLNYYVSYGEWHSYLEYKNNLFLKDNYINPFYEMGISLIKFVYVFNLIIPFAWIGLYQLIYFSFECKQEGKKEIINNDALTNFGKVKYILTEKTGILSSKKYIVKLCSIEGEILSFFPMIHADNTVFYKSKNLEQVKGADIYCELFEKETKNEKVEDFMFSLCMCHSVKMKLSNKENNIIEQETQRMGIFSEDFAQLDILDLYGYKINRVKKNLYKISNIYSNCTRSYVLVGRNSYSQSRKCMSIIIKSFSDMKSNQNENILLCKSSHLSVLSKLSTKSQLKYALIVDQIKTFQSIGYHFCILLKKTLTKEETTNFMKLQKQAQNFILQHDNHLEALANEYEQNLEYYGTLFYEEKTSYSLPYSLSLLQNAKIKTWIVSGDSKDNVMSIANKFDMYSPNSLIAEFSENEIDEDDLYTKMNLFLMQFLKPGGDKLFKIKTKKQFGFKKQKKPIGIDNINKNLTILIHGKSFSKIISDKNNMQRFVTLLSYCKNLFAYGFSPQNKLMLCKLMKKYIIKNSKILAIGSGFNDYSMMKEADLSIGIKSDEILQMKNICDIVVHRFKDIIEVILVNGTFNTNIMKKILMVSLYSNFLLLSLLFFFQNLCNRGSVYYYDNELLFFWRVMIINLSIIVIFRNDAPFEKSIIYLNPHIYKNNFHNNTMLVSDFFKEILKGLGESIVLVYYILNEKNTISQNGNSILSIKGICNKMFIYQCIFTIYIKIYCFKLQTINLLSVIFGIISISLCIGIDFIYPEEKEIIYEMITIPTLILEWLLLSSLFFLFEYIVKIYNSLYEPNVIRQIEKYFAYFIKNYTLLSNFDSLIRATYDICPSTNNDDDEINNISFPEVLENIEKEKDKVDLALENSKIFK